MYPIENIEIPTLLVSGTHDTLSDPRDVKDLAPRIKNLVGNLVLNNWNHVDFVMGEDAYKILYPTIIHLIEKYNGF